MGQNEVWFRAVNEQLERRSLEKNGGTRFRIVCECDREDCTEQIELSIAEYEAARVSATAFIMVPGHADPGCERIVMHVERYEIVQKFGEAALVAEAEDPRS